MLGCVPGARSENSLGKSSSEPVLKTGLSGSRSKHVVHIKLDEASEDFQRLAIYDGMTQSDVANCIRSAAKLEKHVGFDLINSQNDTFVHVSAMLPDGIRVILKRKPTSEAALPPITEASFPAPTSPPASTSPPNEPSKKATVTDTMTSFFHFVERNIIGSPPASTSPRNELRRKATVTHMRQSQSFTAILTSTHEMKKNFKVSQSLGNDRTLLAWTRTALAIMNNFLSVMALAATAEWGHKIVAMLTVAMAFFSILFFYVGWTRFVAVNECMEVFDEYPEYFAERLDTHRYVSDNITLPFYALAFTVSVFCFGIASKGIVKGH